MQDMRASVYKTIGSRDKDKKQACKGSKMKGGRAQIQSALSLIGGGEYNVLRIYRWIRPVIWQSFGLHLLEYISVCFGLELFSVFGLIHLCFFCVEQVDYLICYFMCI